MRRCLLALLLLAGCAAPVETIDDGGPAHNPPLLSQTNEVPFFPGLHWGMTEADIRAAYPQAEDASDPAPAGTPLPPRPYLQIAPVTIGACPFRLRIEPSPLSGNRLDTVVALYTGADAAACARDTEALFVARFGEHPSRSTGAISSGDRQGNLVEIGKTHWVSWQGPKTTIWLISSVYADHTNLEVQFNQTGAPGTVIE